MDAWIDNECTQEELKRSPGSLFTAQMIEHLGVIFLCLVFWLALHPFLSPLEPCPCLRALCFCSDLANSMSRAWHLY